MVKRVDDSQRLSKDIPVIGDDSSSDDADFVKIPISEDISKEFKRQRNRIKNLDICKTIPRGQVIRRKMYEKLNDIMESCRKFYSNFGSKKVAEVMDNNLKIMINFSNMREEHIKKQAKNKQKNITSIEIFFTKMCQELGQLQNYVDEDRELVNVKSI